MSKHTRWNAEQLEILLRGGAGRGNGQEGGGVADEVANVQDKVSGGGGGGGGGAGGGGGWGAGSWDSGSRFGRSGAMTHRSNWSSGTRNGGGGGRGKVGLPVVLHIECRDLADMDLTSRSDPFVVMYIARLSHTGEVGWVEVGRTETVWDCLDPAFVTSFDTKKWINSGGVKSEDLGGVCLKVEVYDNDDKGSPDLSRHDYIGAAKCRLEEILRAQNMNLELRLRNSRKKNPGFITLMADTVRTPKVNVDVTFNFSLGRDISSGLKRAFITISRSLKGGKWTPVHRTETITIHRGLMRRSEGNQREFRAVVLKLDQLTAGVDVKPLRIEFWRFKKSGSHERLGIAQTHYEQLKNLRLPYVFNMKSQNPNEMAGMSHNLDHQLKKRAGLRSYASGFGSRAGAALIRGTGWNDNDQLLVLQDRTLTKKNGTASFTFRLINF